MWQCGAEQQGEVGVQAVWTGTALLQALEPGRFEAGECPASKKQFDVNSEIVEGQEKKDIPLYPPSEQTQSRLPACLLLAEAGTVTGTALGQGHGDPPGDCTRLAATGSKCGLCPLPLAQSCCLWGEQPQDNLVVGACLREPNADSCLLAGILAVYRKPTSCFGLRDMGDKPVLVAPKNPVVGMRSNPGIPWALLGLWLCSSCSIPPNPASNKSALPSPS